VIENYLLVRNELCRASKNVHQTDDETELNSGTVTQPSSSESLTKIRKLAHAHFHGLSREKARNILDRACMHAAKGVRLRTDGDKDALERRFREFVHLNNAQLNALQPLGFEEVIAEVNRRETLLNKAESGLGNHHIARVVENLRKGHIDPAAQVVYSGLIRKVRAHKRRAQGLPVEDGETTAPMEAPPSRSAPAGATRTRSQSQQRHQTPTPDTERTAVVDSVQRLKDFGVWRVVHSVSADRPFFYNTATRVGQFKIPTELMDQSAPSSSQPSQAELEAAMHVAATADLGPESPNSPPAVPPVKRKPGRPPKKGRSGVLEMGNSQDMQSPSQSEAGTQSKSGMRRRPSMGLSQSPSPASDDDVEYVTATARNCNDSLPMTVTESMPLSQEAVGWGASTSADAPPTQVTSQIAMQTQTQTQTQTSTQSCQWTCPACTLLNPNCNVSCQLCGTRCPEKRNAISALLNSKHQPNTKKKKH